LPLLVCRADPTRRLMVGLVGYPNVGKSSTINAIFGSKKTAVAATPGKTKHFQTLNVSPTVCLCDCPGEWSHRSQISQHVNMQRMYATFPRM